jgi:hypothetical protein
MIPTSEITQTMVPIPGPWVRGYGDVHGAVAYEAIRQTHKILRYFFRDFGSWTSGWLEDDERVVASTVRVVTRAYAGDLRSRGESGWSEESLASIARRASRETLDKIRRDWGLGGLIRRMRRYYNDPRNGGEIDRYSSRCLLLILEELHGLGGPG